MKQYGLIAQELEKVIPEAVTISKPTFIPSIHEFCKVINNGMTIVLDKKLTSDISGNRLQIIDNQGNKLVVLVEYIEGTKYIHLEHDITSYIGSDDKIFVVGQEVNDFRTVNYNIVLTANIAATKELSKQLNKLEQLVSDIIMNQE